MLIPDQPDALADLARRQVELVRAMAGGATPDGFDPVSLAIAAQSLVSKRAKMVRKSWPTLADALGGRFEGLFASYVATASHALDQDGFGFCLWLKSRGAFPEAARMEWACRRAASEFPLRVFFDRSERRLVMVYRIGRATRVRYWTWRRRTSQIR